MSNIFDFRSRSAEPLNSDFLKDADDTVEFDLIGREADTGSLPQYYLRDDMPGLVLRDWSNQELANIYRVKKLLDAAGVVNSLERGVTDEGIPGASSAPTAARSSSTCAASTTAISSTAPICAARLAGPISPI